MSYFSTADKVKASPEGSAEDTAKIDRQIDRNQRDDPNVMTGFQRRFWDRKTNRMLGDPPYTDAYDPLTN